MTRENPIDPLTRAGLPADLRLIEELRQLNLAWIGCVVKQHNDGLAALLADLEPQHRATIAASPFALFRLPDPIADGVADTAAQQPGLTGEALAVTLGLYAFAWHLVHLDTRAARLLLGLDSVLVQRLRVSPIARLNIEVSALKRLPAANLQAHPMYWRELVAAVRNGNGPRQRAIQLRGLQLVAADAQSLLSR